ncbi:hypothetical protein ACFW04_007762 [Cataglyphis niger]
MFSCKTDLPILRLTFALACIFAKPVFPYVLPDPTFEVLKPQGLRVSIPDAPGLRIFGFHANVNKAIRANENGEIAGDVYLATNGRWIFEDLEVTVKKRDVLHYWIYAQVNGAHYKNNVQTWRHSCTSTIPEECSRQALSYSILPPIISARLTTKERFVLRYGKIEIRARFPQGDWLYPEMWLEPKYSTYGANYASGRVLLGMSRGNENLVNATDVSKIYDARRLDFGVRVLGANTLHGYSLNIREILVSKIHEFGPRWTKDFHVYTTIWTSDGFTFLVDGEEIGRVRPDEEGWMTGPNVGRRNAPFDQEFYITLGVGVGGVRVFPDNTTSSGSPKPWRNLGAKAMLNFWNSRNEWLSTWRQDGGKKTAFAIDYIKVWSH